MKRISIRLLALLLPLLLLVACEPDQPTAPVLDEGDPISAASSFRVLALGNSLSAGFMNNGLGAPGQVASFPNLIARQIWPTGILGERPTVGGPGIYVQMPLLAYDPLAGMRGISSTVDRSTTPPTPKGMLYVNGSGQITQDALVAAPSSYLLNSTLPHPYDNMGIPGAYSGDVATTTDLTNSVFPGNAFFDLILRPGFLPATTQLTQFEMVAGGVMVVGLDDDGDPVYGVVPPMLATIWIGNNDILLGAASGDPVVGANVVPSVAFQAALTGILDAVEALDLPMVALANIPDIASIPFFTTIPNEAQPGVPWTSDEANVALVTLNARAQPGFPDEYTPLGSSSLPSTVTLTDAEVAAVTAQVDAYNVILAAEAAARGWAHVDMHAALADLRANPTLDLNGFYPWDGTNQNASSAFSLDGIHPGERGYAHVANLFLDAINDHYSVGPPFGPFPLIDLTTVNNITGFETAPKLPADVDQPWFTPEGARAFLAMYADLRVY